MKPALPRPTYPPHSAWQAFQRAHFFDYPAAARAVWGAIVTCGAVALGWALWQVLALQAAQTGPMLLALALVALAANLALKLGRSSYTLSVADVFIFTALATLGTPVAVLAAGVDGAIGTWRTSKRLSSRISSPAAAMAAMAVCGVAFDAVRAGAERLGQPDEVATLAALCLVALVPFVLTTGPLMAMMSLKRGKPLRPA